MNSSSSRSGFGDGFGTGTGFGDGTGTGSGDMHDPAHTITLELPSTLTGAASAKHTSTEVFAALIKAFQSELTPAPRKGRNKWTSLMGWACYWKLRLHDLDTETGEFILWILVNGHAAAATEYLADLVEESAKNLAKDIKTSGQLARAGNRVAWCKFFDGDCGTKSPHTVRAENALDVIQHHFGPYHKYSPPTPKNYGEIAGRIAKAIGDGTKKVVMTTAISAGIGATIYVIAGCSLTLIAAPVVLPLALTPIGPAVVAPTLYGIHCIAMGIGGAFALVSANACMKTSSA